MGIAVAPCTRSYLWAHRLNKGSVSVSEPGHPGLSPALPVISCVTLGAFMNHSVLQFSHLKNQGDNSTYRKGLLGRLNELFIACKMLRKSACHIVNAQQMQLIRY